MNTDHLGLKILNVLLQPVQFAYSFVVSGDSLVDHSKGADNEL